MNENSLLFFIKTVVKAIRGSLLQAQNKTKAIIMIVKVFFILTYKNGVHTL